MDLPDFALERYFARHEFSSRHLLSASDCESLAMASLIEQADAGLRGLWDRLRLGYTDSQGLHHLRREIGSLHLTTEPDDVLVLVPEEGIFVAMNCLLSAGRHVVCTFPAYESLFRVARALGCDVDLWEPEETDAGWRFRVETLEALLRPDTRLVVVNFPHNPTGCLPTAGEFGRIVQLARDRDAYLFSDEMYRLLEPDPGLRLPAAVDLYERAVTLAGMSKAFGLPGLRIGWLATRDRRLLERCAAFKDYTTICSSGPSELLALMALRGREAILKEQGARLARNREALSAFMRRHEQVFAARPGDSGPVCFPRLLAPEGAEAFCRRVQEGAGIMILPSTVYGYGDRHVRLGLGREDFPIALDALHEYLGTAPGLDPVPRGPASQSCRD
jgi:aspartate/methionine/tyrosine aminotransferase